MFDFIHQIREARKHEQMNNPHYLKGYSKKINAEDEDIDNIPMAELDIAINLKVMNEKRSDKYLNMERNLKKAKKKSKKSKKHRHRRLASFW